MFLNHRSIGTLLSGSCGGDAASDRRKYCLNQQTLENVDKQTVLISAWRALIVGANSSFECLNSSAPSPVGHSVRRFVSYHAQNDDATYNPD